MGEGAILKKIVVALGGNALQDSNASPTAQAQIKVIEETVSHLADLIEEGNNLVITHGNGPQVGRILIQNEIANQVTPAMPLDVCGAMSQGMIGYHMQQVLGNELRARQIENPVVTVATQVLVDKDDKAFEEPSKPVGPFYKKEEARELEKEKGYHMVEDSGRGYRRVVPSPEPKGIVELATIKNLIDRSTIVIAVGGGGIPVVEEDRKIVGIEAVVDKDLASQILAQDIDADVLIMLTAVEQVAINFGRPNEEWLAEVSIEDMKRYAEEGHFAPGSMLPKVLAGIEFAESRPGRKTIITSLDKVKEAIEGKKGTIIG